MDFAENIIDDINMIRTRSPLVHNITNNVVMNTTANALLAVGASPVMAHAEDEVADMINIANALVINIGTLSPPWIGAMKKAVDAAIIKGIPWILDPVGSGATSFRTKTAIELIKRNPPTIIRGNASEILSLTRAEGETKGVDSSHTPEKAVDEAQKLSDKTGSVVCISGAVDIVISGTQVVNVHNGHPLMPKVTGLGCTASALIGAFAAVNPQPFWAACHAMAVMGIAGELAARKAEGPGTLQLYFLDALYQISDNDVKDLVRIELT